MSAPRLANIPFEHVEAEMAAFPLASEASFRLGLTSLEPAISHAESLWRAAERDILESIPSLPLDEATIIRDNLWFHTTGADDGFKTVALGTYLKRLANNYLDEQGRPASVSSPDSVGQGGVGPEERLRWSWMCRALPPDLLRAARDVVDPDDAPFPLSSAIQQMLRDQGFAETHLHLGAALDFSLAWAALMRALASLESNDSAFKSPGACFRDGRELGTWLLQAALLRLVLAEWLFSGPRPRSTFSDLMNFIRETWRPRINNAEYFGPSVGSRLDVIEYERLVSSLSEMMRGEWAGPIQSQHNVSPAERLTRRFATNRALYRLLIRPPELLCSRRTERDSLRALLQPGRRDEVFGNDPLARVVCWQPGSGSSPETLFISAALRHIEHDENSDFARLFWQLVRVRCLLYRHLIQRPLTPGLQWFVRFFARIKPLRKMSDEVLMETAARLSGKDVGLRSLEVRLGTEKSESVCLKKIRAVECAGAALRNVEVGAVFHFSRKRGGGWEHGSQNAHGLDHSYPAMVDGAASRLFRFGLKPLKDAGNPSGYRFARFYLEQRHHAQALVNVFQMFPGVLRTVRAIDLCTDESGVPTWVMAPLVRWIRDAGREAAIQLKRRGERAIPNLRTSVHAGEDFVHLLTGLRRLDDAITYLGLEEGDRLGHALALGVDPSIWCGRIGRVIQTREERLFDLGWEWSCYAKHGIEVASERLAYVRTEIVRLGRCIFGAAFKGTYAPEDLTDLVDQLHNEQRLREEGFPEQTAERVRRVRRLREELPLCQNAHQLLSAYLCDEKVWREGRKPETINLGTVKGEEAALRCLQEGLRRRVGKLCLTIEVNPSSNLLIGDLGHFEGHPLWRLRPVTPRDNVPPLSICIGSDDPLTFATTLPHEYQLLFDALVLKGQSHEVAMAWIDAAREAGMRARFTLPRRLARINRKLVPNVLGWDRPGSPP